MRVMALGACRSAYILAETVEWGTTSSLIWYYWGVDCANFQFSKIIHINKEKINE